MIHLKFDKQTKDLLITDDIKKYNCEISVSGYVKNKTVVDLVFQNKDEFLDILRRESEIDFELRTLEIPTFDITDGVNFAISIHFDAECWGLFEISIDENNWNQVFSIDDYYTEFARIKGNRKLIVEFRSDLEKLISIEVYSKTYGNQISPYEMFEETIKQIKNYHDAAINRLVNPRKDFDLLLLFDFPEKLKIPCEQYLLYFAQFLRDLGINATSNLKEEAGKVLFSVTPTDDIEALNKIREALAIYLSLSSNPISHSTGDRTVDMVLSGARANAKHLESQLELAIAKLQFKEATLELKDATIEQNQLALQQRDDTIKDLKEMLARGNIFEESLEKVVINGEVVEETSLYRFSREDEIEVEGTPVLEENNEETRIGLVKFHEVTKLKDYGVSLDLPKAIRDLMDYFKRNKN